MAKIYLASKMKHAEKWRDLINSKPMHCFTCRWPFVEPFVEPTPENAQNFWQHDLWDIDSADVVIVWSEPEDNLRGALVEAGYAIAMGKTVIVVGSNENYGTWQYLPGVIRVDTLKQALNICLQY